MSEDTRISELLDALKARPKGRKASVHDIVETFESRGFGPLLIVPAILGMIAPIPGVPTVCGIFMALVAVQQLFGRTKPWLPERLRRASIDAERLDHMIDRALPTVRRLEKLLKPRLTFVASGKSQRLIALLVVLLSLSLAPLELLPFAAALPSAMLLLIALGMIARDGLVMLVSLGVALVGVVWFFSMLLQM